MSKEIVKKQQGSFEFVFSLLCEFIDICPENIWVEEFGGWPVWQQVYHALAAIDFFAMGEEYNPAPALFEEPGVANLSNPDPIKNLPTRQEMKGYAMMMKERADAYFDAMDDKDILKKNEGLSKRTNREWDNARTLIMLTGHILYHLGTCDAALRQHGLRGVF